MKPNPPHHWRTRRFAPWLISCVRCGLIPLKNARTEKAIKQGCRSAGDTILDVTGGK